MARKRPEFDLKLCMACRACVQTCPFGCLEATRTGVDRYNKAYPELARPEDCTGCGLCAAACPISVVAMRDLEPAGA
jgi:NAD-dependent dihydropyrimidine dehydrogenase PreA subunit